MKTSYSKSNKTNSTHSSTLLRAAGLTALLIALIVMSLPEQAFTKKKRKLPINSYISGAKIAFGVGNSDRDARPLDALYLLDSCTMWYGMIPEVYFWETLIHSDLAGEIPETDTVARKERILKIIGATDSLAMACEKENKNVKKKYKKKCKPFLITADSIRAEWFTKYYNDAQENRGQLVDIISDLEQETDEESKADLESEREELLRLTLLDYGFASILAHSDSLELFVYQNLGNLFVELEDYEKSVQYLEKAAKMAKASDPGNYLNLLNQMAFSNYQTKNYLAAARIWHEVLDEVDGEQKIDMYNNILACFATLDNMDSVLYYNQKILEVEPSNAGALAMIGSKWFGRIQELNQQISKAADDNANSKGLKADLKTASDSAITYLERAYTADSTDAKSIELYGIANMLIGDRNKSAEAWIRLTALKPDDKTFWVYLGDNYIALQKLEDAIVPYERAVAIDESDRDVWRNLISLYGPNGMTEKLKKAQAKYDALTNK